MDGSREKAAFDSLKNDRSQWEYSWQKGAELLLPRYANFTVVRQPGDDRSTNIYDGTAALALTRFAAAMDNMLTPRQSKWHNLVASDPYLMQDDEVRMYFENLTNLLFKYRYAPAANFASNQHDSYMMMGAFGTGSIYIDADNNGIHYRAMPLSETYFTQDYRGRIDGCYRFFTLSPKQAVEQFGEERLPSNVTGRIGGGSQYTKDIEFLQCIKRNLEKDESKLDYRGMEYTGHYVHYDSGEVVKEGGFRSWPFAVNRYVTTPDEIYARGPADIVFGDIKTLQEMAKTSLRVAHRRADPPLLLADDGVFSATGQGKVDTRPGRPTVGGLDARGNPRVRPLEYGEPGFADNAAEQRRQLVNDAFLVTLFQILVETPRMTATEALIRAQEKGALLTPTMGRQQSEGLGPLIERELSLMESNGAMPPMPPLLEEAQGEYEVIYDSPLTRSQRADEVLAVQRTYEVAAPFMQANPKLMQLFDGEEIVRLAAEVNGQPMRTLRTREQWAEMQKKMAQQEAMQSMVQAGPEVANTAKALAETQQILAQNAGGEA